MGHFAIENFLTLPFNFMRTEYFCDLRLAIISLHRAYNESKFDFEFYIRSMCNPQ